MTIIMGEIGIKLKTWSSCIRYQDAFVALMPAVVGIIFSLEYLNFETGFKILYCTIGTFFLMVHIFSFNDWADMVADHQDPKKENSFLTKDITEMEMLSLAVISALASLLIFVFLSRQLFMLAILGIALSTVYSFPNTRFQGKRIPFLSSILHMAGSSIAFLLGYALFSKIDARGIYIGFYFSLLFVAGHLMQEVQDFDGDRLNGTRTHAVRFGQGPTFITANVLFTLSYIYIFWLAQTGIVPSVLKYLLLFYPVHIIMVWQVSRNGLDYHNMRQLRDRYRLLYGLIVLIICVSVLALN